MGEKDKDRRRKTPKGTGTGKETCAQRLAANENMRRFGEHAALPRIWVNR
jgi:hypothetical protein